MIETKKAKCIKISLIINILIFLLTVIALIIMFTGFKFMNGQEIVLESTKLGVFKFFTVDSNMFMGIVALLFAIKEIGVLRGNIDEIPAKYYVLKLMGTVAVGLTFFVVFAYLEFIVEGGIALLLMNSNLFLHLIIPVLSILNFAIFEKIDKLKFKYTFFGLIPTMVYAIYYVTNVLIHMENGKVSPIYDWYWFVQNGVWTAFIVTPVILIITYIISLLLWKINKKTNRVIEELKNE